MNDTQLPTAIEGPEPAIAVGVSRNRSNSPSFHRYRTAIVTAAKRCRPMAVLVG